MLGDVQFRTSPQALTPETRIFIVRRTIYLYEASASGYNHCAR